MDIFHKRKGDTSNICSDRQYISNGGVSVAEPQFPYGNWFLINPEIQHSHHGQLGVIVLMRVLYDLCSLTDGMLFHTYHMRVMDSHNKKTGGDSVGYPVGGVGGSCAGYGGMGTAAFALVLFILLVIILRSGIGGY